MLGAQTEHTHTHTNTRRFLVLGTGEIGWTAVGGCAPGQQIAGNIQDERERQRDQVSEKSAGI